MSNLKALIKEANETFGIGSLMLPELDGEMANEKPEIISTGSTELNLALGIGGLPRGRIVEILGEEASGKSTLALHVIAEAQSKGLQTAYIDTEHSLDRKRAEAIGVDFNKMVISQPDSAEQALDLLDFLVRSKDFGVIVIDSVAALVSKAEIEGDSSDANIGVIARLMGKAMRKIVAPANRGKTMVVFINQLRDKISGFGFPQKVGAGGNSLKFYASVRLDLRRTGNNKKGENVISTQHKIIVRKNKFATPMAVVIVAIGAKGFISI